MPSSTAFVSVSGVGGRTVRGVGASASTSGGHGNASSHVQLTHVSLYKGLIRASSVKVDASANGNGGGAGGKISHLVVAGESKGSPTSRHTYDLGGYGHMVVLDRSGNGIAGIRATLTRDYLGILKRAFKQRVVVRCEQLDWRYAGRSPNPTRKRVVWQIRRDPRFVGKRRFRNPFANCLLDLFELLPGTTCDAVCRTHCRDREPNA